MLLPQKLLPTLCAFFTGLTQVAYAGGLETHGEGFVPDAVLVVTEIQLKQSCVPTKNVVVVNGTSPGPELKFKEGETVWIRVYNNIPNQNLTMHWHGLTQATAPFSDGTPQAAQWPIPSGYFFDYQLSVKYGMAGTYFYHSHVGFQAISATGPLTIMDAGPLPYKYDGERFIFIQDNFPDNDSTIEHALLAKPMAYEKAQTTILVNGKGGGLTSEQEFCNETLSVINVLPGKTYRFRTIGGTSLAFVSWAIEGHDELKVIEADGAYTEPLSTSFFQVAPGQRYSALLETKINPEKQQYYIQLESRDFGPPTRSYAILNYLSGYNTTSGPFYPPAEPPMILPPTDSAFLDYKLCPIPHKETGYPTQQSIDDVFPTADEVTRTANITFELEITPEGELIYLINGETWTEPLVPTPYLVSLYQNDEADFPSMERALLNQGLDNVTYAFPAQIGEVLEVVIQGKGSTGGGIESHPWHAHGAHYWDLGSGDGVYNRTANEEKWAESTGKPVKRDTTMVYSYPGKNQTTAPGELRAWRAFRIRIDEPGIWMIHCHLLPHMVWGMQTAWVYGNRSEVLSRVPRPDVEGYLKFGGSVMGNETNPPEVVNYYDLQSWAVDHQDQD